MKQYFSLGFNLKKIILVFVGLFLLTLPLNTKKFILAFDRFLSEFNSTFLYLSDITLILFLFFCLIFFKKELFKFENVFFEKKITRFFFILFIFSLFISLFFASNKILALEQFIRLILLLILVLVLIFLFGKKYLNLKIVTIFLIIVGVFESILGSLQFLKGRSLNLWFLGEPIMNQFFKGVARYQILNLSFLRSVGTLPHANIYAAFLVLILACFYYLWFLNFKRFEMLKRIFLGFGMFLIILALIYSFSRSGWLSAIFLSFLTLIYGLLNKDLRFKTIFLALILLCFYFLIKFQLGWLINPRLNLPVSSPSVNYRLVYNQLGIELLKEKPFGVGLKNQVLYLKDNSFYQKKGLFDEIEFQPVHNLFLIILNEVGILGFFSFFGFIFFILFDWFLKWKLFLLKDFNFVWALILFFTFLFFGLFDHFFWTLQPGRLMLFLAVGMMLGVGFQYKLKEKNIDL